MRREQMHGFETNQPHSLRWVLKSCCQEHFFGFYYLLLIWEFVYHLSFSVQ